MKLLKYMCPPILWDLAKWANNFGLTKPSSVQDDRVSTLKSEFLRNNLNIATGSMAVRADLTLRVHPHSHQSFKHFCYLSPEMVQELDAFLAHTGNCQRLLDIGALHGIFSLVFALRDHNRNALAIDASPIAFATLLYNVHANTLSNVECIECAVSDARRDLEMHYEWEHAVASGAHTDANSFFVQAQTGDTLCEERDFLPDVVKIDVEGHELKVLRGHANTIARCRPVVFLEVHPSRLTAEGGSTGEIAQFFVDLRYSAKKVDGSSIALLDLQSLASDERIILLPQTEIVESG